MKKINKNLFLTQWLLLLGFLYFGGCINTPIRAASLEFDGERAFEYLEVQCEFGPRPPGSDAHEKTREYLVAELKKYSKEVTEQKFEYKTKKNKVLKLTNIIAGFGKKGNEKILFAAHWDTRPLAEKDPDPKKRDTPIMGANDGASGVAVLLELARIMQLNPPKNEIIIVLFDGEDYGRDISEMFIGSKFFSENMGEWQPDYGILLDMIGDKDLRLPIERNSYLAAPELTKLVWQKARDLGLDAFVPRLGPSILDDHISLIKVGVPCIDLIDFDYPYWHTTKDTPDKCSAESLETVGRLMVALIY